jgi:hypothetical protein
MKIIHFALLKKLSPMLMGLAMILTLAAAVAAQSSSPVTRVEEDWEMDVMFAKDDLGAPQVVTMMTPDGSSAGNYFSFEINHSTLPEPENGGMQVQAWSGDESYEYKNPPTDRTLERKRELIRWTQVVEIQDGWVTFSIKELSSQSLGQFVNEPLLRVSMPTSLADLSAYSPSRSVNDACVPYALNRVYSMTLKSVRYYDGVTLQSENQVNNNVLSQ